MTCSLTALVLAVLLALPPQERPCGPQATNRCQAYAEELADAVGASSSQHWLRATLLLAVAWRESRWDVSSVSQTGDWGLWQLNPDSLWYRSTRGICAAVPSACVIAQANAAGALIAHERRRCGSLHGALTAYHWGSDCERDRGYATRVLQAERWLLSVATLVGGAL